MHILSTNKTRNLFELVTQSLHLLSGQPHFCVGETNEKDLWFFFPMWAFDELHTNLKYPSTEKKPGWVCGVNSSTKLGLRWQVFSVAENLIRNLPVSSLNQMQSPRVTLRQWQRDWPELSLRMRIRSDSFVHVLSEVHSTADKPMLCEMSQCPVWKCKGQGSRWVKWFL